MKYIAVENKDWEEFKRDIINEVRDVLESQFNTHSPKKWLTTSEAGELLNVKPRTIYLYSARHRLNPKKVGGILLFDRSEIEELIIKSAY